MWSCYKRLCGARDAGHNCSALTLPRADSQPWSYSNVDTLNGPHCNVTAYWPKLHSAYRVLWRNAGTRVNVSETILSQSDEPKLPAEKRYVLSSHRESGRAIAR